MVISLIIFIVLVALQFWFSQMFSRQLFGFWLIVTKSKSWATRLFSLVMLPGTLIHELSHWIVAELLMVPTGSMKLTPVLTDDGSIRMGSVAIVKVDPFRRTAIGLAPVFVGIVLLMGLSWMMPEDVIACRDWICAGGSVLIYIAMFMVSNTMFSSKKDLEAAFVPMFFVVIFGLAWWYFGWSLPKSVSIKLDSDLSKLNIVLFSVIGVNLVFFLFNILFRKIAEKIFRRRLVRR